MLSEDAAKDSALAPWFHGWDMQIHFDRILGGLVPGWCRVDWLYPLCKTASPLYKTIFVY